MKFIDATAFREYEASRIAASGDAGFEGRLVAHAGRHLAARLAMLLAEMGLQRSAGILFFVGKGNNGADALAAACELHNAGYRTAIRATAPVPAETSADGATPYAAYAAMARESGMPFEVLASPDEWDDFHPLDAGLNAVWVDALLGTGAKGAPRGAVAAAIRAINARPASVPVVAVDLPSGLDPATGEPAPGATVRADYTLCMAYAKSCLATAASRAWAGTVETAPMPELDGDGVPPASPGNLRLIEPGDLAPLFRPRPRAAHKGSFGKVLVVGGSPLYPGALVLAADAANRSGAGLVCASTSPAAVVAILARCPGVIARDDLYGDIQLAGHDAILCGPGLGRDAEARRVVATLIHETPAPLVLDADALTLLGGKLDVLLACPRPLVLTPHAAEAASLLGTTPSGILADRQAAAAEIARRANATVVLKGDATLVASPGEPHLWVNLNGNPGMATGGSGDILAGVLAGLIGQGMPTPDAARAAVWLHGAAGDIAARRHGELSLRASDLCDFLPAAFRSLHRPLA